MTTGMKAKIFACTGSGGVGFSLNCTNIAPPIRIGRMKIRVARRQVLDPADERRLAHLDALEQHPVEREEERDLHQHRQAAGDRVDLLALVELHHRAGLALAIVLVALLHGLEARRDRAHLRHRAAARLGQLVEHELDQEASTRMIVKPQLPMQLVDLRQQPEQRLREDRQLAVVGGAAGARARWPPAGPAASARRTASRRTPGCRRPARPRPDRPRAAGSPCP